MMDLISMKMLFQYQFSILSNKITSALINCKMYIILSVVNSASKINVIHATLHAFCVLLFVCFVMNNKNKVCWLSQEQVILILPTFRTIYMYVIDKRKFQGLGRLQSIGKPFGRKLEVEQLPKNHILNAIGISNCFLFSDLGKVGLYVNHKHLAVG